MKVILIYFLNVPNGPLDLYVGPVKHMLVVDVEGGCFTEVVGLAAVVGANSSAGTFYEMVLLGNGNGDCICLVAYAFNVSFFF